MTEEMEMLFYVVFGWLVLLTWKLYGYRSAIIALQRDVAGEGGLLDEVTRPK